MRPTKKVHVYAMDELSDMLYTIRGDPDLEIAARQWPDPAGCLRWTAFFLTALTGPHGRPAYMPSIAPECMSAPDRIPKESTIGYPVMGPQGFEPWTKGL